MSEIRWDPLKGLWVIIDRERGRRLPAFLLDKPALQLEHCPFCYGNEGRTPPEIEAIRPEHQSPNTTGWQVRVIPNRHPVLAIEGDLAPRGHGLYDRLNGIGAHEIVIENPDHDRDLADFAPQELVAVLRTWQRRLADLRRDLRFRAICLFRNQGPLAGADIAHPHSQIIALPLIPPPMAAELHNCREYFGRKERCLQCDLLRQELHAETGIVHDDGRFVALAPYASGRPFELRLVPRRHEHDFARVGEDELLALAEMLRHVLARLRRALRAPSYRLYLRTAPPQHERCGRPDYWSSLVWDYHWYVEIHPCLARETGIEQATGVPVNPVAPEDAAAFLRGENPHPPTLNRPMP